MNRISSFLSDIFIIFYLHTLTFHLFCDSSKNSFCILTVKIPEEILYWSLENREKFVKSMKIGNISVYNGRGMVIGCARAGKSTLVKKLKGEKNLNTTSTSGIEVHSHLFKLHENESTITGKHFQHHKLLKKLLIINKNFMHISVSFGGTF